MSVIQDISEQIREDGVGGFTMKQVDTAVTRLTTGMNWNDLRALARGDAARRPNPRLQVHSESFWFHIKPSYYHEAVTKITHTFRLGMLSTYFFVVEIITGIFLMIFYAPTPETAYGDMINIMSNVPFGQFMRDIHRLTAEAMVIVVVLHMARTYLTGSYKKPRQFTWATGVVLLLATLFMSFSGYLLPWDQLAFWAVTIGTSMADKAPPPAVGNAVKLLLLGAPDIGAAGLLRFYLLHVLFVPLAIIIFFFVHYYKVVRVGISLPSSEEEVGQDTAKRVPADRRRYYLPEVFTDEMWFLGLITFILLGLIVFGVYPGAPLEHHANPLKTPLHTEAPWYFLWIQGLLKLGDPTLMGVIVPTLVFGFLLIIPYIDFNPSRKARDRRLAISLFLVASAAFIILTWMGTPWYAVASPPAEEVVQLMLPEEGVGPVRATEWEYLTIGNWDTRVDQPDAADSAASEEVKELMAVYEEHIHDEHAKAQEENNEGLPNGYGGMIIEEWQEGLKKVTMRVFWQPEGQAEKTFEKAFYIHQDSGYSAE
jgi:quinol-cytochrome oxidoreductase complex cytochrome b subunit